VYIHSSPTDVITDAVLISILVLTGNFDCRGWLIDCTSFPMILRLDDCIYINAKFKNKVITRKNPDNANLSQG